MEVFALGGDRRSAVEHEFLEHRRKAILRFERKRVTAFLEDGSFLYAVGQSRHLFLDQRAKNEPVSAREQSCSFRVRDAY
jgi:hypothetical protein